MLSQLDLFGQPYTCAKPVNVSSVPQRSPFRYPGVKTWLVPYARQWFASIDNRDLFIEPFCGGATIGLAAAAEGWYDHVLLCEIDEDVSSVWKTILSDDCHSLVHNILSFRPTAENLNASLNRECRSEAERAYRTLLRNRTVHGGIMAHGSGTMKNGENGKGVFSRWYPATIAKRIEAIHAMRNKIDFCNADAFTVIEMYKDDAAVSFFVDPPYTIAGRRLYNHFEVDHERLFALLAQAKGHFLMTYDNVREIRELSCNYGFCCQTVLMQTTHLLRKEELLIADEDIALL